MYQAICDDGAVFIRVPLQDTSLHAELWMRKHWCKLLQQLEAAGWNTSQIALVQSDCTAEWGQHVRTHID